MLLVQIKHIHSLTITNHLRNLYVSFQDVHKGALFFFSQWPRLKIYISGADYLNAYFDSTSVAFYSVSFTFTFNTL